MVVDQASPAAAPLFAGWRALPRPDGLHARTTHTMNALRELRMAVHAAALLAEGVPWGDAVRHRQPHLAASFGWEPASVDPAVVDRWEAAERRTDLAMAQHLSVLDADQLAVPHRDIVDIAPLVRLWRIARAHWTGTL